jgi:hypothetical protein
MSPRDLNFDAFSLEPQRHMENLRGVLEMVLCRHLPVDRRSPIDADLVTPSLTAFLDSRFSDDLWIIGCGEREDRIGIDDNVLIDEQRYNYVFTRLYLGFFSQISFTFMELIYYPLNSLMFFL